MARLSKADRKNLKKMHKQSRNEAVLLTLENIEKELRLNWLYTKQTNDQGVEGYLRDEGLFYPRNAFVSFALNHPSKYLVTKKYSLKDAAKWIEEIGAAIVFVGEKKTTTEELERRGLEEKINFGKRQRYLVNLDGQKDGECITYGANNNIMVKEFWQNGERHGESTKFYTDGTIGSRGTYEYGCKEGWHYYYHEDGSLSKKKYYDGGNKLSHTSYHSQNPDQEHVHDQYQQAENGDMVLHGKRTVHYSNGEIESYVNWNNGRRHGDAKYFYEDGRLESHYFYIHGKMIGGFNVPKGFQM